MKIICNNKVIDLDKFDTVTCRESLVGEGFPIEAVRREVGGFFGGSEKITEEICRMTKMSTILSQLMSLDKIFYYNF